MKRPSNIQHHAKYNNNALNANMSQTGHTIQGHSKLDAHNQMSGASMQHCVIMRHEYKSHILLYI